MLKDLIRVGPPQGTIDDLDLKVPRALDHGMKNDFDKELKLAKAELKEKDKAQAKEKDKQSKDVNQVSKKSSGGIKKKMTRAKDDKSDADKPEVNAVVDYKNQPVAIEEKISNIMVSNEGELEIADSEENLPVIAPDQSSILNLQAQNQDEPNLQPQSFQYLTNAEKALLSDIDISDTPAQVEPVARELAQSLEMPEASLLPQMPNNTQAEANNTDNAELQPTALESKVFEVLSKETQGKNLDQKFVQQDVVQKSEQPQMLNQTNAVLAQNSSENEHHQDSNADQKHNGENQSQNLPKFDVTNDLATQVQALHAGQRSSFQSHLGAAMGSAHEAKPSMASGENVKDENIREIMNQAKFLVTKGGGEMTVRMTPEGMGEVQLKVALDNGKINIELNSQDKSVKKMIEDSLSDLKSSLASHQMRVEHVKINNVSAVDTNNQSQFQSDANSSNSSFQNRQHQEMNFQNMANSSSGRDRHHHERGSREYQQAVQAPTVTTASRVNAYVATNKGSSINMVA